MRVVLIILIIITICLQVRLWIGDGSIMEVITLQREVNKQEKIVATLKERNAVLEAEVKDLKHHFGALEERARTDLGMIKKGETFYQN